MKKNHFVKVLLAGAAITAGLTFPAERAEAKTTQTINVAVISAIDTLDSVDSVDITSSDTIGQIAEGLYRVGDDGQPELGLAKAKPTVSKDGKTYTFKLRKEKWSNGDAVTAGDFVYAYQKTVDPKSASGSADQLDIFKNAEAIRSGKKAVSELGVKAIDDQTLEIQLENPISYLPQILVGTHFVPQDKAFAEKAGDDFGSSAKEFVGNGPFNISGWDGTNDTWKLTKNANYWDAKNVKLKTINVSVIKETATAVNMFDSGQLDYTPISDVYVQQKKDSPNLHKVNKALVGYVSANQKRKATSNVHLRQALLQAIDKKALTKSVLADGSTVLNGFVPKGVAENPETSKDFRKENGDLLPYDTKEAKSEWQKAKEDLGVDKLTLELISADTDTAKKTVEFIQGQLQENLPGLTIKVKSVPLANRLALQSSGDYDLAFGTWTGDYGDPYDFLKFYSSTGGLNTSGYASDSYDKKLSEAQNELANDPEARWDKLLDAEKQLIETDTAVLPLYQGSTVYLQSKKVKGIKVLSIGRNVSFRSAYVKK